jgi:hypothetical protein
MVQHQWQELVNFYIQKWLVTIRSQEAFAAPLLHSVTSQQFDASPTTYCPTHNQSWKVKLHHLRCQTGRFAAS